MDNVKIPSRGSQIVSGIAINFMLTVPDVTISKLLRPKR